MTREQPKPTLRAERVWPHHDTAARFHHHVHEHLEHGVRNRHRRGWPPFDAPDFAGGFGGPGGFEQQFAPRTRAARGVVRAAILVLLAEKPSHGYQILQELERRSDGAWRGSPGSVYPT